MPRKFEQMDALTGELWRELMVQAWPLRIVSKDKYAAMTAHLNIYDDPPNDHRGEHMSRNPKLNRVTEPPEGIEVTTRENTVTLTCHLCTSTWWRDYSDPANKLPEVQRAASGLRGHLENLHDSDIPFTDALAWVERQIANTPSSGFRCAPPNFPIRCRL